MYANILILLSDTIKHQKSRIDVTYFELKLEKNLNKICGFRNSGVYISKEPDVLVLKKEVEGVDKRCQE